MKNGLIAALLLLIGCAPTLKAQNGTITPYSGYGYGMLRDAATSTQRSMGGVGYAMQSGRQINAMNPASYAAIDTLTFLFDIGLDLTSVWNSENGADGLVKDNRFGGGLDYVTMQFPIFKRMAGSVGLIPYSSVGYSFGNNIDHGFDSRQGSGSLNEVYLGVSALLFKGFTVGAQASYLFGSIINDTYALIDQGNSTLFQKQMNVRDYRLNFGLQYGVRTRGDDRLSLGLTFSPAVDLRGNAMKIYYETSNEDASPEVYDRHRLKGNYSLPSTWGAGVNYRFDRSLMVEFDFTYQPWKDVKYRGFEDEPMLQSFSNRTKYALGLQYVPNFRGSYFKRVNYRAGTYYTNDYLVLRGNRLREYGVTAGLGFPVPGYKTTVNLGFEWIHRQANPDPLIKENYLNITIGVNFNELWFNKSKIY